MSGEESSAARDRDLESGRNRTGEQDVHPDYESWAAVPDDYKASSAGMPDAAAAKPSPFHFMW